MSNPMAPHGAGVMQIMRILGIANMEVIEFTLTCRAGGALPVLTVLCNPAESNHVGYAAKHFTLTEVHHDDII